jgi:lipoprotein-releasing system ATP-binding protein
LLELKNISKTYPSPGGLHKTTVLSDINLSVSSGDSLAITGPSGSGKSTLLNLIGTLDRPTSGTILFNNQDITKLDEKQTAEFRNQKIGFVFQQHYLLPQCTVLENVLLPTLVSQKSGQDTIARDLLDRVGLSEHLSHLPSQLSGGEQQRVAVVRSLINQPDIILADEPTGSLDQNNSEKLGDLLNKLNNENKVTLIIVTHSLTLAAKMKKTYSLIGGQLVNTIN